MLGSELRVYGLRGLWKVRGYCEDLGITVKILESFGVWGVEFRT